MDLLRPLLSTSAVKMMSLAGGVAFSWLVSLLLPISEAGRFFSVLAITPGIAVLIGFGIDQTILRLGATQYTKHGIVGLETVMGYGARSILLRTLFFIVGTVLVAPLILRFHTQYEEAVLRWVLALVVAPFFAALLPSAMGLRVQSRYVSSILAEPSAVMAFAAGALVIFSVFFQPQFWIVYILYGLFLIVLSWPLFRKTLVGRTETIKHDPQFGITQVAQYFLQWGVIGQISFYATSEEIISISLSMRMVMMINLILILVNTVNGHKISKLIQAGQNAELRQLLRQQSPILLVIGVCSAAGLGILSPYAYAFLGPGFEIASDLTCILILGQLANVLVGPANIMLNMSGNASTSCRITIAIGIPVTVLVWPIYQLGGVLGAAALISVSVVMTSLLAAYFATNATGIRPMWPKK